jgi:DNA polymerase-3 subunit delta
MAKAKATTRLTHAFDFLAAEEFALPRGICVLFGGQRFLKLLCMTRLLGEGDGESAFANSRFEGNVEWPVVMDEVHSQSLFGGGADKVVLIDGADEFVKEHRERLEKLCEDQHLAGTLVLVVDSWPGNTKLYKAIDKFGLPIHCDLPESRRGKSVSVDSAKLNQWIIDYARKTYDIILAVDAAATLGELTENNLGRIDSELEKVSLFVKPGETVTQSLIREHVGGWKSKTVFQTADAIMDGKIAESLLLIDRLISSGEHPLSIFGQLAWSFRRYPRAVEIYDRKQKAIHRDDPNSKRRPDMNDVLFQSEFYPHQFTSAQLNLKRLGRRKVERIGAWLVELDLMLKGSHSRDERARLAIEKFLFWLETNQTATA